MRNFWKTNKKFGLEKYLTRALQQESRFSHFFVQVPCSRPAVQAGNVEDRVVALAFGTSNSFTYTGADIEMKGPDDAAFQA